MVFLLLNLIGGQNILLSLKLINISKYFEVILKLIYKTGITIVLYSKILCQ